VNLFDQAQIITIPSCPWVIFK